MDTGSGIFGFGLRARVLCPDLVRAAAEEHRRWYASQCLAPGSVPTHFLATSLGTSREDLSDCPQWPVEKIVLTSLPATSSS
jgi:hypothetical protein